MTTLTTLTIANFRAWEGRDAVDDEMESVSSSVVAQDSHVRTISRHLEPDNDTVVVGARKKPSCPFIDVEAEHSGNESEECDEMDDGDPTLNGFIVPDRISEHDENSDSGSEGDSVDTTVTRTRTGRDVRAPLRFDAMIEDGQHCKQ